MQLQTTLTLTLNINKPELQGNELELLQQLIKQISNDEIEVEETEIDLENTILLQR